MNTKKECPISATGRTCLGEKCKLWITHTEPAYTKKCEKQIFASDVMSQDDYKTLVKLALVSENTESVCQTAKAELSELGEPSIFRPFKSSRINALRADVKKCEAMLVSAEKRMIAVAAKYTKIVSQLASDLLKEEGWRMSFSEYDNSQHVWHVGGAKVIGTAKRGCCGLTEEGEILVTGCHKSENKQTTEAA